MTPITAADVRAAALDDWHVLARALHAHYPTGGFATGYAFVQEIAEVAEAADHHPDLTLRYATLDVRLLSHDVGALTRRDLAMARQISEIAAARGLRADPAAPTELEVALDVADPAAVAPFWSAVLTGSPQAIVGREIIDPRGQLPTLWLQQREPQAHVPPQRFHLDVWVPSGELPTRLEAAVAAGGRLVDETRSPTFVVLADAEGNHACLCTATGRG